MDSIQTYKRYVILKHGIFMNFTDEIKQRNQKMLFLSNLVLF